MPEHDTDFLTALESAGSRIYRNLSVPALIEESIKRGEAVLTARGALRATTGQYTGRSPRDKFIVDEPEVHDKIDWGAVNHPLDPESFELIRSRMLSMLCGRDVFVFDGFGGADRGYRLPIRIISTFAWHSLFARQLFVRPTPDELIGHAPAFTILDAPAFRSDPETENTRSETVIALSFHRGLGLIGGTEYAGEIKKSIFTVLNFYLPARGVFPMHCSANVGPDNDTALFFGLSGTGKTTLSADPERRLIGDDEHGWSENGIFNFEGGCYAKCIHLSAEEEPEIWDAIRYGSVLENVALDAATREELYDDSVYTENTRAAYPVDYIPNAVIPAVGGHPRAIILLTADAGGVLPPIARLTTAQAMYYFLSGYTSKLAGAERGVTVPEPNFSACFGAPFWPLPPTLYAQMLGDRLRKHSAECYLVNTGWTGGPYGIGRRIPLHATRAIVRAALLGELTGAPTFQERFFGLQVPTSVPGVPQELLDPRQAWPNTADYDIAATALAEKFTQNFGRFPDVSQEIQEAGPKIR